MHRSFNNINTFDGACLSNRDESYSGGVCPQIQGRQCGAYVGAVEEMMCVVCVDVTEGA